MSPIKLKTILIAEHEKLLLQMLSRFLHRHHYLVIPALDGIRAWDLFIEYEPDLVLTTNRLPGIDFPELVERIKEREPSVPVILMTAYRFREMCRRAPALGIDDCIGKPLELDSLLHKIEELLKNA
jgi:DNA-binding response OmpR family regulator